MCRALSACLLFIFLAGPALAETFVSVAPVTVDARDKEAPSPALVRELLISCLSQAAGVAVVERADLNAVMEEKSAAAGFTPGKGLAPRLHGVNYVITGSAAAIGREWLFSLQASDPATAQIVAAHSATVGRRRLAGDLCENVGAPLAGKLVSRPHNSIASLTAEKPEDAQTQTLLLTGIGYAKSKAWAQAFPFFLKVLDRDPRNADACYWLAVSYDGAGLPDLARREAAECLVAVPGHPRRKELEALSPPPEKPAMTEDKGE